MMNFKNLFFLSFREKPLFSHPVTGNFIVQYAEEVGSPSPCSYVLPRKSCREKNAPAYTFGSRCFVEKSLSWLRSSLICKLLDFAEGGSRTGWQKQWFAHSDPFTTKVDFNREKEWPTPFHYPAKTTLGNQITKMTFPAWSMGTRLSTNPTIASENNPSPDTYDTNSAFRKLMAKNTRITMKSRPGGTQVSTNQNTSRIIAMLSRDDQLVLSSYNLDVIPGPDAYDDKKFLSNKLTAPKYSFGKRMPTSLGQDPYVNTLPSMGTWLFFFSIPFVNIPCFS